MRKSQSASFKGLDWWHFLDIRLLMRDDTLHDTERDFQAAVIELGCRRLDEVSVQQLMITSAPKGLQRITQMCISDHLFKAIERVREHWSKRLSQDD